MKTKQKFIFSSSVSQHFQYWNIPISCMRCHGNSKHGDSGELSTQNKYFYRLFFFLCMTTHITFWMKENSPWIFEKPKIKSMTIRMRNRNTLSKFKFNALNVYIHWMPWTFHESVVNLTVRPNVWLEASIFVSIAILDVRQKIFTLRISLAPTKFTPNCLRFIEII